MGVFFFSIFYILSGNKHYLCEDNKYTIFRRQLYKTQVVISYLGPSCLLYTSSMPMSFI